MAGRVVWLQELGRSLEKLQSNEKWRKIYLDRFMEWAKIRLGTPSRRSPMTLEQEKAGWQIAMKDFDHTLWLVGAADADELRGHVALPDAWIKNRESTVIVCSDQIPIWVKIKVPKSTFSGYESVLNSKDAKIVREGKSGLLHHQVI